MSTLHISDTRYTTAPLSLTVDFYMEGKKVNSKSTKFEVNKFSSQVYAIHAAEPDKIIDSTKYD